MSSRTPTKVTYSLDEFSKNGSRLRSNRDGWGIALARDRDAFLVKEPEPAADSVWVRFVAEHAFESTLAIAHVRYATPAIARWRTPTRFAEYSAVARTCSRIR